MANTPINRDDEVKTDGDDQRFPWWAMLLIVLASFRFEYHSESGSSLQYDGTKAALLVIGVISVVMVFGVTKRIQRVLKAKNLVEKIPRSRFWALLPFSIILPAIGYRALSEDGFVDRLTDKYVSHWEFIWGDTALHFWLIVGTLAIIFLHTIILTLSEIERTANSS